MSLGFHGWPTSPEWLAGFAGIRSECIFVLDANVLLNLYRYSPRTYDAWINILKKISDRVWIPHQAALEYQENRLNVISSQEDVYNDLSKVFQNAKDELETRLRRGHLSIDVSHLVGTVKSTFQSLEAELQKHREQHPDLFNNDVIREAIGSLLHSRVGEPYSQERLTEIFREGEKRYENRIAPGYKDRDKKGVKSYGGLIIEERFGDLILWLQIIDKAKEIKTPIVFITDDGKEDWWWEHRGKVVGPRPDLITEMRSQAGVPFYMYNPKQFLDNAHLYLDISVNQEIINEVLSIAEATSWKDEIASALSLLGGRANLSDIYNYIASGITQNRPYMITSKPAIQK